MKRIAILIITALMMFGCSSPEAEQPDTNISQDFRAEVSKLTSGLVTHMNKQNLTIQKLSMITPDQLLKSEQDVYATEFDSYTKFLRTIHFSPKTKEEEEIDAAFREFRGHQTEANKKFKEYVKTNDSLKFSEGTEFDKQADIELEELFDTLSSYGM